MTIVLESLREQVMNEEEPLAGLLRKCLIMGHETKSSALLDWARHELNGYTDPESVPDYRRVSVPQISSEFTDGYVKGSQTLTLNDLPAKATEHIQDYIFLRFGVEELENVLKKSIITLYSPHLEHARLLYNSNIDKRYELELLSLKYIVDESIIAGILSRIRTQLVEIVMELTTGIPLTELPKRERVDAIVIQYTGDIYNTTGVQSSGGAISIGTKSKAISKQSSLDEVIKLVETIKAQAKTIEDEDSKKQIIAVLEDIQTEVQSNEPNNSRIIERVGRLRSTIRTIANSGFIAMVSGAVEALTDIAMSGATG